MKKKSSRRRIDVNVDELDRIIDDAMRAPLNETDGRTLKTVVHAMAERLVQWRNTEKTSAVLEPKAPASAVDMPPQSERLAPSGHGRNGAAAFTGANRVAVAHATLQSGDPCLECREGRVYRQKEPATLIRIVGQAPLQATVFEMERLRCNACGEVFAASEPPGAGAEKFDATAVVMIALFKYGNILGASHLTLNGWLIIDGGGNRPAFDAAIAAEANLCILPFRASEEDLDTVADDMRRIPNAVAWPTAWPTNAFAERAAVFYVEALAKAFPLRVINTPIPFVNSVSELLAASLDAPSSPVRQLARRVFDVMADTFDERQAKPTAQAIAS